MSRAVTASSDAPVLQTGEGGSQSSQRLLHPEDRWVFELKADPRRETALHLDPIYARLIEEPAA